MVYRIQAAAAVALTGQQKVISTLTSMLAGRQYHQLVELRLPPSQRPFPRRRQWIPLRIPTHGRIRPAIFIPDED